MITQILLGLLGALAVGVLLIVLGLRGKRLNDHPVCRDCRFDLLGVYPGVITCPECGSGLRRPKAVRDGQRRRRPAYIAIGAILVITPGLGLGTLAFATLAGADLNTYKPVGLLLWEGRNAGVASAQAAGQELLDRLTANRLSKAQVSTAVAAALDLQGDPDARWSETWGDLIERARLNGNLSDAQVQRWRHQAAVLEWRVRPRVRSGDPIPVCVSLKEARVGSTTELIAQGTITSATLDTRQATIETAMFPEIRPRGSRRFLPSMPVGWLYLAGSASRMRVFIESPVLAFCITKPETGLGRRDLAMDLDLLAEPSGGGFMVLGSAPAGRGQGGTGVRHSHGVTVEVLPADAPVVDLVTPTPELMASLTARLSPRQSTYSSFLFASNASQQFSVDDLPVPVAFDVIWKVGDREWKVGSFTSGQGVPLQADDGTHMYYSGLGGGHLRHVGGRRLPGFRAKAVTVILRPSPAAALLTVDLTRIYGGELVFEDVDITR